MKQEILTVKNTKQQELDAKKAAAKPIIEQRPCKKCANYSRFGDQWFGGSCHNCNYLHDNFRPKKSGESMGNVAYN